MLCSSEVTLLRQQFLDLVIQPFIIEHFIDVLKSLRFDALTAGSHRQSVIDVVVSAVAAVIVCPFGVAWPRLWVSIDVWSAIFSLSLHLNIKLSQSGQERGNILVGLPKLLFVLSVLAFVAAELVGALNLDPFVLRDKLLDFGHKFDSFFLGHDYFILVVGLNSADFLLGLA